MSLIAGFASVVAGLGEDVAIVVGRRSLHRRMPPYLVTLPIVHHNLHLQLRLFSHKVTASVTSNVSVSITEALRSGLYATANNVVGIQAETSITTTQRVIASLRVLVEGYDNEFLSQLAVAKNIVSAKGAVKSSAHARITATIVVLAIALSVVAETKEKLSAAKVIPEEDEEFLFIFA